MSVQDLEALIAELRRVGDDMLNIEAKRASTDTLPKSCAETLSAFANTHGGVLVLGLDEADGFKATGIANPPKIMKDLGALASTALVPSLRPTIQCEQFEGVNLVTCEVEELDVREKPCYVASQGQAKGSYIRVHDGDQRLSQYEIQVLLANRGQPKDDLAPVLEATIDDLDKGQLNWYATKLRTERPYAFGDLDDEALALQARITVKVDGKIHPTVAGLLALGRFPQAYFPQLNVTFVHYPTPFGDNPKTGERFIDSVSLDGPIPTMIQEALRVVRRNMSRRSTITGAGREDAWEYPETALREAIVNACIHRDFSPAAQGTQVQIEMYPDRLIIRNPGGLYGPVTEYTLGEDGISSSRNAHLLRILEDVPLPGETRSVCENRGSGIRAMINSLRAANMSLPVFRNRISHFEVMFPNHALLSTEMLEWLQKLNHPDLTETQFVALASMKQGMELSNESYRTLTGIDSRVATNELQDLVARELVDQDGNRRWARYTLKKEEEEIPDSAQSPSDQIRGDRRILILNALGDSAMSRAQIEEKTGLGGKVVTYWLRKLRASGQVVIEGDTRLQSNKVRYKKAPSADEINRGQQTLPMDI